MATSHKTDAFFLLIMLIIVINMSHMLQTVYPNMITHFCVVFGRTEDLLLYTMFLANAMFVWFISYVLARWPNVDDLASLVTVLSV